MKILMGALLAVVLALGFTGWRLQAAQENLARAETLSQRLQSELERQVQAEDRLADRLERFDSALARLHETTEAHSRQLRATLDGIDRIQKTEEDSDEAIACLDQRVPADLDHWVR